MKDNRATFLSLAERVQAGKPDRQHALVFEAWQALKPSYADPRRVLAMLDAEAYESAATTLVPEGFWWTVGHVMGPQPGDQNMFWATCHERDATWPYARPIAATPALALTAAVLRARAEALP